MKNRPSPPARYTKTVQKPRVGAYGEIEVWHDAMLDRDVAIKWITSHEGEEQLLNEWRVLSSATSKHIVEIYDLIFDHHGALHGVVMEYVDGQTLSDVAAPDDEVTSMSTIKLLYQFSLGLENLHEKGIIHRDVKPDNAIIGSNGILKVCDFGLSSLQPSMNTVRARSTMGFLAPELTRSPSEVTLKTDVFSFGLVCFKALTGGLPTVGRMGLPEESAFPLPKFSSKWGYRPRLSEVIDQTLSWRPLDRPNIKEVSAALRSELTMGQHVGSISVQNGTAILNSTNTQKRIVAGTNEIQVTYDGYHFIVNHVAGNVLINNSVAVTGAILGEGCILTFGSQSQGASRGFSPFRQFTPEVVI